MSEKIILLIPYFGAWPAWFNLFVESCKWNPEVRWRFYTDCGKPQNEADNLDYVHLSFDDYKALVRKRFGIDFNPSDSYKLCDLKPCLGDLHGRDIAGFPFYGYGDIDVIYGNIRKFYTDEVLALSDILSTHASILSGHFAVFRNTSDMQHLYERIPDYERLLHDPKPTGITEGPFVDVVKSAATARLLFVERYSTVLSPLKKWHDGTMNYPESWFWSKGRLTNNRDHDREFLYLHFMRWKSSRYIADPPAEGEASWLQLDRIVNIEWQRASAEGFSISRRGFWPLTSAAL